MRRKKALAKWIIGLLTAGVVIALICQLFFLLSPAQVPHPEERHGASVSLGEGLAVIVRDDGELWVWTDTETDAEDGMARKLDDHVTAARQILCRIAGYAPDGQTIISEEKVFLGILYEDSRFAVREMDLSGNILSDKAQLICSDAARFQAGAEGFSLVRTDGSVWNVQFSNLYENYDQEGLRKPIVTWETVLSRDDSWRPWRGPVTAYQVSRTEEPQYYILTEQGGLWGKGENGLGQLGIGRKGKSIHLGEHGFTDWTKVTDHVAEVYTMQDRVDYSIRTLALKTDGSLWGWGYAQPDAELKNYQISMRPVRIMDNARTASIGRYHDLILKTDGTLLARGSNQYLQLGTDKEKLTFSGEPLEIMNGVRSICAAGASSYAVRDDGSLWTWGRNDRGQLGHGTIGDPELPMKIMDHVASVTVRDNCAAAVLEDGSVWIWGDVRMNTNVPANDNSTYAEPICVMEGRDK